MEVLEIGCKNRLTSVQTSHDGEGHLSHRIDEYQDSEPRWDIQMAAKEYDGDNTRQEPQDVSA